MESIEERIVVAARGWRGTRFHHQGRLKASGIHKGGVDCLGLLVGVAAELDLRGVNGTPLAALDRRDYGHYPNTEALAAALAQCLMPIDIKSLRPGDVALFSIDGLPQHMGIIASSCGARSASAGSEVREILRSRDGGSQDDGLTLIHAYAPARKVVEHALDGWWRGRVENVYRIPILA